MHVKICSKTISPAYLCIFCGHNLLLSFSQAHLIHIPSHLLFFLCLLHTYCSPLLLTSPHKQFIVGTIALFLITCDSLFASFQSGLPLTSAFRWRDTISHFLLCSRYLWILTFLALCNCHLLCIFHCQVFLFHDKYNHSNTATFFLIDSRIELGWNFCYI